MTSASPKSFGRYEVVRPLGRGAVGEVYLARDPKLDRLVAIKILSGIAALPPAEQDEAIERFLREARAAAALSHPNIVTIHDVGEQDHVPYMAMEFLEGTTLDRYTAKGHLLPPAKVIELGIRAAHALAEAHGAGLVHRDIKPANLLLLEDGTVKVTDFGLAKDPRTALTAAESIVGTPNYMSPEQIAGGALDGRSDLFSLTVSLYELLTGRRPFSGDSISSVLYRIVNDPPHPLRDANPHLPESLQTLLELMLSKKPEQRQPTGSEFAGSLMTVLKQMGGVPRGMTLPMPSIPTRARIAPSESAKRDDGAGKSAPPKRRRRSVAIVVVLLMLMLAVAGLWTAPAWLDSDPIQAYRAPLERWLVATFGDFGEMLVIGPANFFVPVRSEPPGLPLTVATAGISLDDQQRLVIPSGFSDAITVSVDQPCRAGSAELDPAALPDQLVVSTQIPLLDMPIASEPSGARVKLDGREVEGRTPLDLKLEKCSDHTLEVVAAGRPSRTIDLPAGASEEEWRDAVTLVQLEKPAEGFLTFPAASYPVTVSLSRGGRSLGRAGAKISLAPGSYRLRLSAPEVLYSEEFTVKVRSNATARPKVNYPPLGKLSVRAVPPGGDVLIKAGAGGGRPVRIGETPLNGRTVVAGTYDVFVGHPTKGVQVTKSVAVPGGDTPAVIVIGAGEWP